MKNIPSHRNRSRRLLPKSALTALLLSAFLLPAWAQSPGSGGKSSDQWQYTVAPYILLPWMNGTTAVKNQEVKVDVGPGAIFENLQFSVMGYFEARKSRWGVGVDAVYMALGTDLAQPSANVDLNQGGYTFTGIRQLNEKVDLTFGLRWNVIQGKLDFKGPVLKGTFRDTKQWVDPLLGVKIRQPLGGPLHFTMLADLGGFGAGSDLCWQLFPVIGADVGKRTTLGFGYRVLSNDYATSNGDQRFKYDVVTQAFVLGAAFHF